jgi:hypothetical protein
MRGGWRKFHDEELDNLYSSHNINWVIKLRKTIWVGHVARMDEKCIQTFSRNTSMEEATCETQT